MQKKSPIINFNYPEREEPKRLFVTIETERLIIQTVTRDDIPDYQKLFNDPIVMGQYYRGECIDPNQTCNWIEEWIERWGKDDPFNGMTVFMKDSHEFVGHVVLGRSGKAGVSELAYIFHQKFWGNKIGSEVVWAMVNHYAPAIIHRKFLLDGLELKSIIATTHVDHLISQKILRRVGMETNGKINKKYGAKRYIFEVSSEKLLEMLDNNL